MKTSLGIARAIQKIFSNTATSKALFAFGIFCLPVFAGAQAVTGIITDYKGFWKTSSTNVSPIKPDNSHNLLAFTYNGVEYSTGVNNELLSQRGEHFTVADFWALPVGHISASLTPNTKAGFGALYDGVFNGPSLLPPLYGISCYLTDGIKGLNLGTCIANLPAGTMTFTTNGIRPSSIGDGVPDILVTQIADPSGSYDRYEFTDANGNRVGNYKDIVFTNISAIANWTADFYEARINPLSLLGGFTQTDRPIRLWAADLSEFGITAANYNQIRNFQINLSGNSDVAFVAYNNGSVSFQNALPVQYSFFKGHLENNSVKLNWQTVSEQDAEKFVVERSADGISYQSIGTVHAKNTSNANDYSFTDASPLKGKGFYRLRQVDFGGSFTNSSTIVKINTAANGAMELNLYPNPTRGMVWVEHDAAAASDLITLYNSTGMILKQVRPAQDAQQTRLDLNGISAGSYCVSYQSGNRKTVSRFVVQ